MINELNERRVRRALEQRLRQEAPQYVHHIRYVPVITLADMAVVDAILHCVVGLKRHDQGIGYTLGRYRKAFDEGICSTTTLSRHYTNSLRPDVDRDDLAWCLLVLSKNTRVAILRSIPDFGDRLLHDPRALALLLAAYTLPARYRA